MQDINTFTNERYLNTPQKKLKRRAHVAKHVVEKLQERITRLTQEQGETLEASLQSDMLAIMEYKTSKVKSAYPEGSFAQLV